MPGSFFVHRLLLRFVSAYQAWPEWCSSYSYDQFERRFVFAQKACGEFQRIIGSEAAEPLQRPFLAFRSPLMNARCFDVHRTARNAQNASIRILHLFALLCTLSLMT